MLFVSLKDLPPYRIALAVVVVVVVVVRVVVVVIPGRSPVHTTKDSIKSVTFSCIDSTQLAGLYRVYAAT